MDDAETFRFIAAVSEAGFPPAWWDLAPGRMFVAEWEAPLPWLVMLKACEVCRIDTAWIGPLQTDLRMLVRDRAMADD